MLGEKRWTGGGDKARGPGRDGEGVNAAHTHVRSPADPSRDIWTAVITRCTMPSKRNCILTSDSWRANGSYRRQSSSAVPPETNGKRGRRQESEEEGTVNDVQ